MDPSYTSIDILLSDTESHRPSSPLPPTTVELSSRRPSGVRTSSPYGSGTNLSLATGIAARPSALSPRTPPTTATASSFSIPIHAHPISSAGFASGSGGDEEEYYKIQGHHYRNSPLARKLGLKPVSRPMSSNGCPSVEKRWEERATEERIRYSFSSNDEEDWDTASSEGRVSLSASTSVGSISGSGLGISGISQQSPGGFTDWWSMGGSLGGSKRKISLPISSNSNSTNSTSSTSSTSNSPTSTPALLAVTSFFRPLTSSTSSPTRSSRYSSTNSKYTPLPTTSRRRKRPPSTPRNIIRTILASPFIPTRTPTLLLALLSLSCLAFLVTMFMIRIVFNVDPEPLPWRTYCQNEGEFPHDVADALEPVNVFVGVFSVDAAYERRQLIRSTYVAHSTGAVGIPGRESENGGNIVVKFILGKPRAQHARRIALEMETYNDVVVLDEEENMNRGKTHAYFSWAWENATVPFYFREEGQLRMALRKADYVVKADDDAFLVLGELERHLRVSPRERTYWGYLIRNRFMGGECYALSSDLVQYVATYEPLLAYTKGAEDKKVAKWMRMHPQAASVNWVSEKCWIYDHPKAGTTYSHGFLFPNEVERVRKEGEKGITEDERLKRGGTWSQAWSSVTRWKTEYVVPKPFMTMEEEVEALIEGGSRFRDWTVDPSKGNGYEDYVPYNELVYAADDPRLPKSTNVQVTDGGKGSWSPPDPASYNSQMSKDRNALTTTEGSTGSNTGGIGTAGRFLGTTKIGHEFSRDPVEFTEEFLKTEQGQKALAELEEFERQQEEINRGKVQGEPEKNPSNVQKEKRGIVLSVEEKREAIVLPPTLTLDPTYVNVRKQRFLDLPHGGTVVVHYLKRNEWFLETALALLGRSTTWDHGSVGVGFMKGGQIGELGLEEMISFGGNVRGRVEVVEDGSKFGTGRRYGSPIVREDGYISEGRQDIVVLPEQVQRQVGGVGPVVGGESGMSSKRPEGSRLKGTPKISFTEWNNQIPLGSVEQDQGEEESREEIEREEDAQESMVENDSTEDFEDTKTTPNSLVSSHISTSSSSSSSSSQKFSIPLSASSLVSTSADSVQTTEASSILTKSSSSESSIPFSTSKGDVRTIETLSPLSSSRMINSDFMTSPSFSFSSSSLSSSFENRHSSIQSETSSSSLISHSETLEYPQTSINSATDR